MKTWKKNVKKNIYNLEWFVCNKIVSIVTALTPQATFYRGAEHTSSHTARAVKDGCANGHILELYYVTLGQLLSKLLNPNNRNHSQINKEKFTESENQVLTPDVIRHQLKIRILKYVQICQIITKKTLQNG